MTEDLPPSQRSRRGAAREKLAARRQRARVIRRRVAGMSLATFLAASGAVLVQFVTGHDPALGHSTHKTSTVALTSRSTGSGTTSSPSGGGSGPTTASSSAGSAGMGSSSPSSQSSSAAAASPSAVTTSAS